MTLPRRGFLYVTACAVSLPAASRFALAQAYPSRPVRIIVGFGAGGAPDILARLIGQWLSERLGQQFIVEYRPGAGSNIATEAVVHAPADGHPPLLAHGKRRQPHTLRQTQLPLPSRHHPGRRG